MPWQRYQTRLYSGTIIAEWAGYVMLPAVKIAWHRGNSPLGLRRVITLTAPGARKP